MNILIIDDKILYLLNNNKINNWYMIGALSPGKRVIKKK